MRSADERDQQDRRRVDVEPLDSDAEQQQPLVDDLGDGGAEDRADHRDGAADQQRAAEHRAEERRQQELLADAGGERAGAGREQESGERREQAGQRVRLMIRREPSGSPDSSAAFTLVPVIRISRPTRDPRKRKPTTAIAATADEEDQRNRSGPQTSPMQ